ncbi:hypothetical protein BT93_C0715 [Corymbia citriodora subsp. variegata]|nr:hypothetical protein BT93_C0715 [Corymbia citriodora subsp. variegata]
MIEIWIIREASGGKVQRYRQRRGIIQPDFRCHFNFLMNRLCVEFDPNKIHTVFPVACRFTLLLIRNSSAGIFSATPMRMLFH